MAIVINEHTNEAVRTNDPQKWLREWIEKQQDMNVEILGVEGYAIDDNDHDLDWHFEQIGPDGELDEVFSGFMVCDEGNEGSEGIAVGFSSADRQSFPFPWPVDADQGDDDEFLGNGDPMVYKTVGVPEETVIQGREVVLPAN